MSHGGDPRIGTEVAGFRIEGLIGRGGMGVVYLAEQLRYGRKVALKILAPEFVADESFRERFEQEWRTAARLEHPNIVPIYEAGEADGVLYIAMRYVEGIDLNALLAREGRLPPARALAIVGQVGAALDAAHAQGLVHRDVKPGNILIGGGGVEGEHVYLTDFGVAKQTRTRTGLTRTGLFIGTVDYAPPEQIEGKLLDGRADVYALGCVLYQCLTGALPYEKDSEVAMLYAHLMEQPPSLRAKRPDVPEALDAVIVKALAKVPGERYASCRELTDEARRAAGLTPGAGRTVVDMPATSLSPARPTVQEPLAVAAPLAAAKPDLPWWRTRAALIGLAAVVIAGAGAGIGIGLAGGGGGGGETTQAGGPTSAGGSTGATGATSQSGSTGETGETGETGVITDTTPVPGALGAIAYMSQRDGDYDIYAMDLDGNNKVRLTEDVSAEGSPRYSPDGQRIAFWSDRDGDADIYTMNADGSDVVPVTVNDSQDYDADWSPDGTQIAYTNDGDGDSDIYIANADGSSPIPVTVNEIEDRVPSWSPDGSQLVFSTADGDGDLELAVIGVDGSNLQLLTQNDANDDAPHFSPDGSQIIFSSDRDRGVFNVYLMNADGTNVRRISRASTEDGLPRFTADGERIVFDSSRDGDFEIFVMNADGSGATQLTNDLTGDFQPDVSLEAAVPPIDETVVFLQDPTAFPTVQEAELLSHVSQQTRPKCIREEQDDRAGRAIAGLTCPRGKVTVFYDLFRTPEAMNGYYDRQVSRVEAARGTGQCESDDISEDEWTSGDETKGRLLCYTTTDGQRVIIWTHKALNTSAWIQRNEPNKGLAYRFWQSQAAQLSE